MCKAFGFEVSGPSPEAETSFGPGTLTKPVPVDKDAVEGPV